MTRKPGMGSVLKIFCDSAELIDIRRYVNDDLVSGFTTNPTLMRNAGVTDYLQQAKEFAQLVSPKEISLEVIADDHDEVLRQARILYSLGTNIVVKIPVVFTSGESTVRVVEILASERIPMNITAIFTPDQAKQMIETLKYSNTAIISVFAGRIADTGVDPRLIIHEIAAYRKVINGNIRILWASPREVLNVIQAAESGCDVITMSPTLISKMDSFGKNLDEFSRETVKMFFDDALKSGFSL